MDDKVLLFIATFLVIVAGLLSSLGSNIPSFNPSTISAPELASNYIVQTIINNGETPTIIVTSIGQDTGSIATVKIISGQPVSHTTLFWSKNGTWYYATGLIASTTNIIPYYKSLYITMTIHNNVLVVYSNGTYYTPTASVNDTISTFTITFENTTIEYTIISAEYTTLH